MLGNNDAVDSLLGNLQAKFFCQNAGDTNLWASGLLGERFVDVTTINVGRSGQDGQNNTSGISRAEQHRRFIEPAAFTTLKRGGTLHDYIVECIVYKGGHLFCSGEMGQEERLPFKLLRFKQK